LKWTKSSKKSKTNILMNSYKLKMKTKVNLLLTLDFELDESQRKNSEKDEMIQKKRQSSKRTKPKIP
jgi:hypothetical protein